MKKRVDARGRSGRAGPPGGHAGAAGSHGQPGTPGEQIQTTLAVRSADDFRLTGFCRGEEFSLHWTPQTPLVLLTARGGDGGEGGDGMRGTTGRTGSRGSDATRYSSGGNGGRGGPGGRGGNAGAGGAAGAGGKISLGVEFADSDLLLALQWNVEAGTPGLAGDPGGGGAGGAGGAGGSSYSWTETQYYTDSEGKSQSRTVFKSNPGGSSGSPGPSGPPGSSARDGAKAKDGLFLLQLAGESYPDRYHLKCLGFELHSGDGNNIFEFGEAHNRLSQARVKNVGPAPSPAQHVFGYLQSGEFVQSHQQQHLCPSLAQFEEAVLPDLLFDLREPAAELLPTEHEVLRREVVISPDTYYSRLTRFDPEFPSPQTLTVTFPVELKTLPSSTSIAQGQWVEQEWEVINLSDQVFPTPGRELLLDLSQVCEGAELLVKDDMGEPITLASQERLYRKIDPIPPGGRAHVSLAVSAPADAKPYAGALLTASLRLTPQGGGEPRRIQRNPTRFKVALAHRGLKADVLLVTNHGSTALEVETWLGLFQSLNLSCDIWDVSLYGELPLDRLSELMRGKLVVLLNNRFESPARKEVRPTDFLEFENFRRAVSDLGVSFYVVGEKTDILDHLVPQPKEAETYGSITEYLKSARDNERVNPEVPSLSEQKMDKIGISHFFVRNNPRPQLLRKKARQLLAKLKKMFPHRRYLVTSIFQPDENEGWLRNRNCGALFLRQMPDTDARAVVVREVFRGNAQTPDFLLSGENLLGVFSAQDFDDKLALASALEEQPPLVLEALADAILMDLTEEQMDLRVSGVHLSRRGLKQALNRTVELCQSDFREGKKSVDPGSQLGRVLVRVVAGLEFLSKHQVAWWDHRIRFLSGRADVEITVLVRKLLDSFLDKNFGPDRLWGTKAPRKEVDRLVTEREKELEASRAEVASVAGRNLDKKFTAVESLVRWELRDYLSSDASGEPDIWDQEQMRALQEKERQHLANRLVLCRDFAQALERGRIR